MGLGQWQLASAGWDWMSRAWATGQPVLLVVLTGLMVMSGVAAVGSPTLVGQHPTQAEADTTSPGERLNSADTNASSHRSVDGWAMARANAANTNHINTTGPTNPITVRWTFETEVNDFEAGPVVVNGTVYFGTQNIRDNEGTLYAVDAWTGEERWTFQSPSGNYPDNIAVFRNTVYISTYNGKVYALDAANGDPFWEFSTEGRPLGLTVANRTLYVTSKGPRSGSGWPEGRVYALGGLRGEPRWAFTTEAPPSGSAAVKGDTVYVSTWRGNVTALDTESGAVNWNVDVNEDNEQWLNQPTVANGHVYIGSRVLSALPPDHGRLYALDAGTGDERWKRTKRGETIASPSVLGDTVYFTTDYLHAVNPQTGDDRWSKRSLTGTPVLLNDIGYIRTNKTLYTLDPKTGNHHARFTPEPFNNSGDGFNRPMAVLNGSLYTGVGIDDPGNKRKSDRAVFYALGTPEFTYANLSVRPQSPATNESVTVTTTVRNTGTGPGSYNATLSVNGAPVNTKGGRLKVSTRTSIAYDLRFPKNGTYTVKVGGLTRTITVGDVSPDTTQNTTLTPVPETKIGQTGTADTGQTGSPKTPTDTTSPGFGIGVWVLAVAVVSVLLRHRHYG